MICEAPASPLEPPAWHISSQGSQVDSIFFGFVTFGTPEKIDAAGASVDKEGVHCGILKSDDGRTELMVIFDKTTTREKAFRLYKRFESGEFGTSDTGYMLLPVSDAKK